MQSPHNASDRIMESPIIRLTDIDVTFDRRPALRGVSLTIGRGDFVAITGPNGGGKTTLLRVILKLLKPTQGKVEYFSADGTPERRLRVGYLPQKSMIDTRFPISAGEAIRSGLLTGYAGRAASADDRRRFEEITELTGTAAFTDRPVGDLSGGQLQRVLLGRALISGPELLVLDEPLSYVDKRFEHQIYHIMEQAARRATIILVSHEMSVISGMANRHFIVDGTLHECGALHHYVPGECWPESEIASTPEPGCGCPLHRHGDDTERKP